MSSLISVNEPILWALAMMIMLGSGNELNDLVIYTFTLCLVLTLVLTNTYHIATHLFPTHYHTTRHHRTKFKRVSKYNKVTKRRNFTTASSKKKRLVEILRNGNDQSHFNISMVYSQYQVYTPKQS
jgi:hypothetical protein